MIPKRIVIHHGGSSAKWYQLIKWWRSRNLKPYYHYVIDWDGFCYKGRQDDEIGRHIKNMNTGSIGICLVGDYTNDSPNDDQLKTLDNLVTFLMLQHSIYEIVPHNRYSDTICPGSYLTKYIESKRYRIV
jgi:N-acetylmuramoyl-L-alanine amidase